jgi:hypothetical protein
MSGSNNVKNTDDPVDFIQRHFHSVHAPGLEMMEKIEIEILLDITNNYTLSHFETRPTISL